jgi:hypothetical protein
MCWPSCCAGPKAYYIILKVPTGTTRQQVDDGLKAAWAAQGLTTDGCYSVSFCAVVSRQYDFNTHTLLNTEACVFVESKAALSPDQALTWVKAAVPSSKLAFRHHLHAITAAEEVDYFHRQLEGQQEWRMCPGCPEWHQHVMGPCSADDAAADEWEERHRALSDLWAVPTDG